MLWRPFPGWLRPMADGVATGLSIAWPIENDIARLSFYEGGFDYTRVDVVLKDGTAAQIYLART